MKRILKTVLPGILMLALVCGLRGGKDILIGIYILFPLMYIIMGAVCSGFAKELLPCLLLMSLAFIVPVNLLYNMGACIDLLLIYIALACLSNRLRKRT